MSALQVGSGTAAALGLHPHSLLLTHNPAPPALAQDGALRPKVLVLTGPTAVGKTKVSLMLAQQLNGEIISADSVQVYRCVCVCVCVA